MQSAVPAGGGGLVVFKDPATGELRQPDADEIRALLPAPRPPGSLTQRPMAMGGFAVMLDSSFDSFMITKRDPDGSLAFDCLTPQEIVATAKARTVARTLPTFKELPDVQ